ncbi:MAG: 16S rRNA (cytosine(1402)-N(4))-methyltransferase RsmH [Gammaproteobacteria bacterium]
MTLDVTHQPVMLAEVLTGLHLQADGVYVDGTFGRGGHAAAILQNLGPRGRLYAIDKDPQALQAARDRFAHDARFTIERGTFAMLEELAQRQNISGRVNGILLDLGVSSPQLDEAQRGFSFVHDGPLDMRMDPDSGMSAADWLASVAEPDLADVLKIYGEERFAKRIARAIVGARQLAPIVSTLQLADIVSKANPAWEKHKHPATRAFQAIRIVINHELDDLASALAQTLTVLAPGGRLVVISFHSLEDRIVKRFMRDQSRGPAQHSDLPLNEPDFVPCLRRVGKAQRPTAEETERNSRARSAVLRVAERVH